MSVSRDRKEAAKRLGLELKKRYNALVTSGNDPEEINLRAIELGALWNENVEFIIWALCTFGGLNPPAPEKKTNTSPAAPNFATEYPSETSAPLPDISKLAFDAPTAKAATAGTCTCPDALDANFAGHMTSCPRYQHLILSE